MGSVRPAGRYQVTVALVAVAMVTTLLASLNGFWKMTDPLWLLLLYAAAAVAFSWLSWRVPWLAGLLLLGAAGWSAWMFHQHPTWLEYARARVTETLQLWSKLAQFDLEQTFTPELGNLFLMGSAVLAGLLVVWEALARGNAIWSLVGGLTVMGVEWAWFYEKSAEQFILYAVLGFVLWAVGQAAVRDSRWLKTGRKIGYQSNVIAPLAWLLVATFVAIILPDHYDPIDLGRFGTRLQQTFPALKQLRGVGGTGPGRFSLAVTGFSPFMDRLGGPVTLGSAPALSVTVGRPLSGTLYLRGATFRTYTGQIWQTGDPPALTLEKDGSFPSGYGPDVLSLDETIQVSNANADMGFTIFNLLEPVRASGFKGNLVADADLNTWADRRIGMDAPYSVDARVPTYSTEQIRLLSTSGPDQKYQPYLQLPQQALTRVQELAQSITAERRHPLDKALALESYLRGLPYSLDVPAAPSGQDFVDYFLFDLKKGYCVYSATAMAVMLRQVGIPSRLVEGYAVPTSITPHLTSEGKYTYAVTEAQAHAWVEAYFSGYGWVTFDPTPRFDLPIIDRSTPLPKKPEQGNTADESGKDVSPSRPIPKEMLTPEDEGITPGIAASQSHWPWSLTLLAAAALTLVFLGYRRLQSQEQFGQAGGEQTVQEAWVKSAGLLRQFGMGRRPDQTPREYAHALGARWPDLQEPATRAAADYTAARYSPPGHEPDQQAPERAKAFWQQVEETLFARFGWRTYLWKRLRWKRSAQD